MEKARLEALLERLQTTKSINELQVWAHELRDYFGVTHVFYHTGTLKSEQVGAFTYSLEWARRYIERDYRSIDPVVVGALRRFHPMDWKSLDWSSPAARRMMREALDFGLGNQGWSVPIWGPQGEFALFCLNHTTDDQTWEAFTRANAKDILVVSHLMHEQAMRIINKETAAPTTELSPRERETLPGSASATAAPRWRTRCRSRRTRCAPISTRRATSSARSTSPTRWRWRSRRDHHPAGGVAEILMQRTVGLS